MPADDVAAVVAAVKRSDVVTPDSSDARTSESSGASIPRRGIVSRPGRVLADGSRRGARDARKLTLYVPPDLGVELDVHAARTGKTLSDIAAEAFAAYLAKVAGR
jgi:hypothetical protein